MPFTDLLPFLGMRKLFDPSAYGDPGIGGTTQLPQNIPNEQPTGGLDDNVAQITKLLLDRLNQPDQNVERMKQLFDQYPVHEKPSIGRRIGAGFTTYAFGPDEGRKFLNAPFDRAMGDWVGKAKQAKDITDADTKNQREEFTNAIKGINSAVGNEREKSLAEKAQRDTEFKIQKLQQDLTIAQGKADLAERTLQSRDANEKQKADALQAWREALIMKSDAQQKLDEAKLANAQRNTTSEISKRDAEIERLKHPNATGRNGQPLTPGMENRAFENKLQRMQLEHPDWAKFVKKDTSTGQYGVSGADPVTTSNINKYLGISNQKDIELPSSGQRQDTQVPNKPPANSSTPNPASKTGAKKKTREDAIAFLQANKKPVTPANIDHLLASPDRW